MGQILTGISASGENSFAVVFPGDINYKSKSKPRPDFFMLLTEV